MCFGFKNKRPYTNKRTYSVSVMAHIHCFKEKQPCQIGLERLKVVRQSDIEDAAPKSSVIDASDTDAVDVE